LSFIDLKGAGMATKETKTAKRRTTTKELPKDKKDLKAETLKKVKGGSDPNRGYDIKKNVGV
jgi:hypothetical protein